MPSHFKSLRKKTGQATQTSRQIEKLFALLAEEKVVVAPGGAFVVRLNAGDVNVPDLSFLHHLFQGAINSGYTNPIHKSPCSVTDLLSSQWTL